MEIHSNNTEKKIIKLEKRLDKQEKHIIEVLDTQTKNKQEDRASKLSVAIAELSLGGISKSRKRKLRERICKLHREAVHSEIREQFRSSCRATAHAPVTVPPAPQPAKPFGRDIPLEELVDLTTDK